MFIKEREKKNSIMYIYKEKKKFFSSPICIQMSDPYLYLLFI